MYSIIEILDYLTKTQVMNLKEFIRDSRNYIATLFGNWIWDNIYWWGYELNFDKSFLHYNAKKKLYTKAFLIWLWILDKVLLDCEKSPPCEAYLKLSWQNYVATYNRAEVNNEPFHLWHGNLGAGDM